MTRTGTPRHLRALLFAPLAALLLAGTLTACSGGTTSDDASSDGGGSDSSASLAEPGAAAADAGGRAGSTADESVDRAVDQAETQAAIISTGSVELTSDDVPDARLDVLKVIARYGGQVADEQTATSPDAPVSSGTPAAEDSDAAPQITHTHLVVRVPSGSFDRAMRDLAAIGHFESSSRQSTDVTTQVIDVRARVQAQARSVARIETLLDRAEDIKEIVLVEGQLSRRQAALESLRRRAAYLADQTSLSTIDVDLDRRSSAERREDHSAFVAGLAAGWHGFTGLIAGALTALGALLPFLLVLLPLGLVLWLLRRRRAGMVRSGTAPGPTA